MHSLGWLWLWQGQMLNDTRRRSLDDPYYVKEPEKDLSVTEMARFFDNIGNAIKGKS